MSRRRVIYGRNAVAEALRAGTATALFHLAPESPSDPVLAIIEIAAGQGVEPTAADRERLDRMAGSRRHQGVVAWAKPYRLWNLDALLEAEAQGGAPSILLLLDRITDPQNFGSILRAADGAGAAGVIVSRRQSAPITAVVARASAGALEHARIAEAPNLPWAIRRLKEAGYWIVGAAAEARESLWEAELPDRVGLALGSEGAGMGRLVRQNCDLLVSIPMYGKVESLNVAQAAGILLYEIRRRFGGIPSSGA